MTDANQILVAVAPGELIDKITILQIKTERMNDPQKVHNVQIELKTLCDARDASIEPSEEIDSLTAQLKEINEKLWEIEDEIRLCERSQDFGPRFVELARSVYFSNDKRAALKRQVNEQLGSKIIEEKSYQPY